MGFIDVETRPKVEEDLRQQALGEDVRELRARGDVEDAYLPQGDTLTHDLKINLNELRALVLHWVARHVHGADVVAVDHDSTRWWLM